MSYVEIVVISEPLGQDFYKGLDFGGSHSSPFIAAIKSTMF